MYVITTIREDSHGNPVKVYHCDANRNPSGKSYAPHVGQALFFRSEQSARAYGICPENETIEPAPLQIES